jgi:hypothetical protein
MVSYEEILALSGAKEPAICDLRTHIMLIIMAA